MKSRVIVYIRNINDEYNFKVAVFESWYMTMSYRKIQTMNECQNQREKNEGKEAK